MTTGSKLSAIVVLEASEVLVVVGGNSMKTPPATVVVGVLIKDSTELAAGGGLDLVPESEAIVEESQALVPEYHPVKRFAISVA